MAENPNRRALTKGERTDLVALAELGDMKLKAALFVLDQFAGQSERRDPMISQLASAMCCSKRTAQTAIAELRKRNIIDYSDAQLDKASRKYTIRYSVLLDYQPRVNNLPLALASDTPNNDAVNRGANTAPLANGALNGGANTAPHASAAPHANTAPLETAFIDPNLRGANDASHNKQTCSVKNNSKQNRGENSSKGFVCLSDRERATRARVLLSAMPRAIKLLTDYGLWKNVQSKAIKLAADSSSDGNPMPRITEVIAMAQAAGPSIGNGPAWIMKCLEKGWKPNAKAKAKKWEMRA